MIHRKTFLLLYIYKKEEKVVSYIKRRHWVNRRKNRRKKNRQTNEEKREGVVGKGDREESFEK